MSSSSRFVRHEGIGIRMLRSKRESATGQVPLPYSRSSPTFSASLQGNPLLSTLDFFNHRWSDKPADQIAFESTNNDWDTLFQQTDLIVATEAIRLHNIHANNYLNLAPDAVTLNGKTQGSVFFMGRRISGADTYAATFKQRVIAVLAAL